MKVLLVGEFSSLHKYLKEGLLEIGVEDVKIAANSEGWKKIGGIDIPFPIMKKKNVINILKRYNEDYKLMSSQCDNDVVQFINTIPFSPYINKFIFEKLKENNKCISLVAAGQDYSLVKAYKNGCFEYNIHDLYKEGLRQYSSLIKGSITKYTDNYVVNNSDVIIPSLYEYSVGYGDNAKLTKVIPFPINLEHIDYKDNTIKGKVVFFHGLNNEKIKGTKYIVEALAKLKNKYPNDVEIIVDGHMPFDKYVSVLNSANVVVDQCLTYGYGINSCIALGQGKVVLSGARDETLSAFNVKECPIISISPNVDEIYKKLCSILENKEKITEMGYKGRKYVENTHDYIDVANQYMKEWKKTGRF